MIEQLPKEDANPSNFSPQHIKNLAKTIEHNRATGQYLSTNANTGANASVNLLKPSVYTSDSKEVSKAKRQPKMQPVNQAAAVITAQQKESCPPWKDNKGKQNSKSKGDCT